MFSASCHYALQAMFYIALHSSEEKNVELSEIAEQQNIPKALFEQNFAAACQKCKLLALDEGAQMAASGWSHCTR
jgi:DNA-binding IscR family transcriptional regulator